MKRFTLLLLAIIIVLVGCGREYSPEKALLGHWENEFYDMYHSSDKMISVLKEDTDQVYKDIFEEEGIDSTTELKYNILASDNKNKRILIKPILDDEDVSNFAIEIKFNEDYTKASTIINLDESDIIDVDKDVWDNMDQEHMNSQSTEMRYVDSKQKP